ncbi:Uncharacterised protein [uncultured archaeon]|nr:Uncharacterised protein [uncultured archaeon]
MALSLPLAIVFGILTIISLFITAIFGLAMHKFHKKVFKFHMSFAFLTLILAIIHLILAYLLWFKGIII